MWKLFAACLLGLALAPATAATDDVKSRTARAEVPASPYARRDNPSCGVKQPDPIATIANGKTATAATTLGLPKVGAVIVIIAAANEVVETCRGGDICRDLQTLKGREDRSSCATMCVASGPGDRMEGFAISDRDGRTGGGQKGGKRYDRGDALKMNREGLVKEHNLNEYAAWERIQVHSDADDRWVVCATAKNWDDGHSANMRLTMFYSE